MDCLLGSTVQKMPAVGSGKQKFIGATQGMEVNFYFVQSWFFWVPFSLQRTTEKAICSGQHTPGEMGPGCPRSLEAPGTSTTLFGLKGHGATPCQLAPLTSFPFVVVSFLEKRGDGCALSTKMLSDPWMQKCKGEEAAAWCCGRHCCCPQEGRQGHQAEPWLVC